MQSDKQRLTLEEPTAKTQPEFQDPISADHATLCRANGKQTGTVCTQSLCPAYLQCLPMPPLVICKGVEVDEVSLSL